MTRNTHDRQLDHHTNDLTTNVELDGATSSYADGAVLQTVISDLDTRVAAAGSGTGMTEFLTGNDVYFLSSVGNWVSSSGAVTLDSNAAKTYGNLLKSLKWASPASTTDYVEVPVTGTFTSGVGYQAAVALMFEESSGSTDFDVILGVPGTDSHTSSIHAGTSPTTAIGNGRWMLAFVYWVPTANRSSGVKFRVTRKTSSAGNLTVHVGYARVVQPIGAGLMAFTDAKLQGASVPYGELLIPVGANTGTFIQASGGITTQFGKAGPAIRVTESSVALIGGGQNNGSIGTARDGSIYMSAGGDSSPADRTTGAYELDVGFNYLDLEINQKDASTIQLWSNYSHANFELADTGTGTWKMRSTDDGFATPSRGMLPQFSSAPSTPAEGWSYYDTTLHKSRTWDGTAWQNHW